MSSLPATDSVGTDRQTIDAAAVAMVALLAASVGYEAGSVLAGDSLELFWLLPVFSGTFVVALLATRDD